MNTQHMKSPTPATPWHGGRWGLHVLCFDMYEAPPKAPGRPESKAEPPLSNIAYVPDPHPSISEHLSASGKQRFHCCNQLSLQRRSGATRAKHLQRLVIYSRCLKLARQCRNTTRCTQSNQTVENPQCLQLDLPSALNVDSLAPGGDNENQNFSPEFEPRKKPLQLCWTWIYQCHRC
jgi:hypothetical protein